MYIKEIRLENYRNYRAKSFKFSPEGCIITGKNGIGKTNLLEAICYSAFGKSVKQSVDSDLINFDEKQFKIRAIFRNNQQDYNFSIDFSNNKKKIKLNSEPISRISSLYSYVRVVYFSAEDIWLINGTRLKRRSFFDQAITQTSVMYSETIRDYYRLLEQRNTILKSNNDMSAYDIWTQKFIEKSIEVHDYRINYLNKFVQFTEEILNTITDAQESIEIDYSAHNKLVYEKDYISEYLKKHKQDEFDNGRSVIGPHLDEYELKINGFLAKRYSSQGQKRSLAIAMRFAQLRMIQDSQDIAPMIIFDDALSELDSERVDKIFSLLDNSHQILIATPNTGVYKKFNFQEIQLEEEMSNSEND